MPLGVPLLDALRVPDCEGLEEHVEEAVCELLGGTARSEMTTRYATAVTEQTNVLLISSKGKVYAVGQPALSHCRRGSTRESQLGFEPLHCCVVATDVQFQFTHPQQLGPGAGW